MKLFAFAVSLSVLTMMLFGCTPTQKKTDVPPPPKTPGQQAAPAPSQPESGKQIIEDYGKGLVNSMDKARGAQAKVDIGAVQDAVRNYQMENGRYPDSLDAIKSYVRPGVNLSLFNYDPGTGTVSLK